MLRSGQIMIFRVNLTSAVNAGSAARLYHVLSAEEQERARRFRTAQLRQYFISAHGILREILAGFLDRSPESLAFDIGSNGKPFLSPAADGLAFNMSHSGEMALYAVAQGTAVGVDIEHHDPRRSDDAVARRFFAPGEIEALNTLSPGDRIPAFFDCWTRKEAFIKAVGSGLSFPLDEFEVSIAAGAARLLTIWGDPELAAAWTIEDLRPAAGYSGAIAAEAQFDVACFTWPPTG